MQFGLETKTSDKKQRQTTGQQQATHRPHNFLDYYLTVCYNNTATTLTLRISCDIISCNLLMKSPTLKTEEEKDEVINILCI